MTLEILERDFWAAWAVHVETRWTDEDEFRYSADLVNYYFRRLEEEYGTPIYVPGHGFHPQFLDGTLKTWKEIQEQC